MKSFYSFATIILIFSLVLIFSLCIFIPIFNNYGYIGTFNPASNIISYELTNGELVWPTPGYTTITSGFGYRKSPTTGAGSYHSGIDIGAPMRN